VVCGSLDPWNQKIALVLLIFFPILAKNKNAILCARSPKKGRGLRPITFLCADMVKTMDIANPSYAGPSRKRRGKYLTRTRTSRKRQKTISNATRKSIKMISRAQAKKILLGLSETKYLDFIYDDQEAQEAYNQTPREGQTSYPNATNPPGNRCPMVQIEPGNHVSARQGATVLLQSIKMKVYLYSPANFQTIFGTFSGAIMPPRVRLLIVQWPDQTTSTSALLNGEDDGPLDTTVTAIPTPDWGPCMAPYNTKNSANCKILYDRTINITTDIFTHSSGSDAYQPWSKSFDINLKGFYKTVQFNNNNSVSDSSHISGAIGLYFMMDDTVSATDSAVKPYMRKVFCRVVGRTTFKDI